MFLISSKSVHQRPTRMKISALVMTSCLMIAACLFTQQTSISASGLQAELPSPIVFVSRQIPRQGTVYWDVPKGMPGVGPYSRFEVCAPGRLIVRETDGRTRTLIDGANPTAASLNLIDVNAPDVSWDGTRIVFAGLPKGSYETGPLTNPGAWRIYAINVDGSGLRQVTLSDRDNLNLSQFGDVANIFKAYDDTDPAWLPDGRIVFSSTRWPGFAYYSGSRSSNLFVVRDDGSALHRITSERNGADRPLIDPVNGRIVFSRWWRNMRFPTDDMQTIPNPIGGFIQHLGLIAANHSDGRVPGGTYNLQRNSWPLATINPDGTGLQQWSGGSGLFLIGEDANVGYGGSFAADGTLYANFFPMKNQSEAAGFGGIRQYRRGPNPYRRVIGVTSEIGYQLVSQNPPSYGVNAGAYAAEPEALPDGRLIVSWAADVSQDYGLYVINADGSGRQLIFDNAGTTELRARLIRPRTLPPIIHDQITQVPSALPPLANGLYEIDGQFSFNALNVYFNAPVDFDVINAIPVGSAGTIRFFLEHQRTQPGSHEAFDWPILLQELPVAANGSVIAQLPANLPLFEQIRTPAPEYRVPLTGVGTPPSLRPGAAHVAGLNYGRPGTISTCVGCHAGHTMIPLPKNPDDAKWTNLAPGAKVKVSSVAPYLNEVGLVDRRVVKGSLIDFWFSDPAQDQQKQWAQLTFPVPVTISSVRLYNTRQESDNSVQVQSATVRLFRDEAATIQVGSFTTGRLADAGTSVGCGCVQAQVVRIELTSVSGNYVGRPAAGLAEIEVIAAAGEPRPIRRTRRAYCPTFPIR